MGTSPDSTLTALSLSCLSGSDPDDGNLTAAFLRMSGHFAPWINLLAAFVTTIRNDEERQRLGAPHDLFASINRVHR